MECLAPTLFRYTIGVFPISSVTFEAILGGGLDPLLLLAFTASETDAWQQMFRCSLWAREAIQQPLDRLVSVFPCGKCGRLG